MKSRIILSASAVILFLQLGAQQTLTDSAINANVLHARQYLTGVGKIKDEAKAVALYLQTAQAGHGQSMNALGIIYKEGMGVKQDRQEAESWFAKAGTAGYAQGWYNLGTMYKDARDGSQDFAKAFDCYGKGAALNDEQSIYARAYMLYKGLGCPQNYEAAARLFERGARLGKPNSMYFLGLCLRNGYGLPANTDSARAWLQKAAAKGYRMAADELAAKEAENSNGEARALAARLRSSVLPAAQMLNQYRKVEHNLPANEIEGSYKGCIIRYDWSGQYAIGSSPLALELSYKDGALTGLWTEADLPPVRVKASLTSKAMLFQDMQYSRADHYTAGLPMTYMFKQAMLQWERKDDNMLLSGNIQMFVPQRNEPEKPLYISLTRTGKSSSNTSLIPFANKDDGSSIKGLAAYPNPFTNIITLDFQLAEAANVETRLMTPDGRQVYSNKAGMLEGGNYTIQIRPQDIAPGTYLLTLYYGSQAKTIKVVKL